MSSKNLSIAKTYYTALAGRDLETLKTLVDPQVEFIAPLAQVAGKEAFLEGAKQFISLFQKLTIRTVFANTHQAMVVYDVDFPHPIGLCPTAGFLTIKNGLIAKVELFYDGRLFEKS